MALRRALSWGLTGLVLAGAAFALLNLQDIQDWLFLRSYKPPKSIVRLEDKASFSEHGQKLFYVSDPQLTDQEQFAKACPPGEQTIVLGCYTGGRIYVLNVEEPELEAVEPVTAAHEMLHAAYHRLSGSEKSKLDKLLREELKDITSQRLLDTIDSYRRDDSANLDNELHSIIGTEKPKLSRELEEHYARYFTDRQKVVKLAKQYEKVFVEIEERIADYDAELAALKEQSDALERELASEIKAIEAERQRMDRLLDSGQRGQYNAAVPGFNAQVSSYNARVGQLRTLVQRYNSLVKLRNSQALRQNSLVESLKSEHETID